MDGPQRRFAGPAASMSLLDELVAGALRADYPARAALAAGAGGHGRVRAAGAAVLAVVGLVLGTAVVQVRAQAPAAEAVREDLRARVEAAEAAADATEVRLQALRADVARAERQALAGSGAGRDLAGRADALALVTGHRAVAGPGVEVVLDDAPARDGPADPDDPDLGRVLDRDLQLVANGLWQAGAEAVAVNGHRLTALSAIRSAGQAVLVDYRPLRPPYTVAAVGSPETLLPSFRSGAAGRQLDELARRYGIAVDSAAVPVVTLPAAERLP